MTEDVVQLQALLRAQTRSDGVHLPPEFATLRLFEEISDVAVAVVDGRINRVQDHLAEICIIAGSLANQYLASLEESGRGNSLLRGDIPGRFIANALNLASRISSLVAYYSENLVSAHAEVSESVGILAGELVVATLDLCSALELDIWPIIWSRFENPTSPSGYARDSYDPSTTGPLEEFNHLVRDPSKCLFAPKARVWSAPPWRSEQSLQRNIQLVAPVLHRFTKAARAEHLDAFMIAPLPSYGDLVNTAQQLRGILAALDLTDPHKGQSFANISRDPAWQFTFAGMRMFVTTFAAGYSAGHVRYSSRTFILLQPEESFDACGISKANPRARDIKERIRVAHLTAGVEYPTSLIEQRIEAPLYLLPEDLSVSWDWWCDDDAQGTLF